MLDIRKIHPSKLVFKSGTIDLTEIAEQVPDCVLDSLFTIRVYERSVKFCGVGHYYVMLNGEKNNLKTGYYNPIDLSDLLAFVQQVGNPIVAFKYDWANQNVTAEYYRYRS